jgi:hypothetical protein
MFYGADDRPYRLTIQNGINEQDFLSYDKKTDKGTLIIYKDGAAEVKTVGRESLKTLYEPKILLAVHGFNLDYEANGSTSLRDSMRKEGWGEENDDIYSRVCYRPGFGWNPSKKKIVIAVKKTNATGLRSLMRSLGCTVKGNTQAVGGDSGGSIALAVDGKIVHSGNRKQVSMLVW